jgi:4-hydroxy-tetrahydrodipicolinate synthase
MQKLKGVGVAMVTPFKPNKEIDFEGFNKILSHIEDHVDYFVVNGTTAEAPNLSKLEVVQLLNFVVKNNRKNRPIVLGLGGNNTSRLLEAAREIEVEDISAILSVTPYYNIPTQNGLYQHYTALADEAERPIILYNVPKRTGVNLEAETVLRLAQHPNIIGVKEASGSLAQTIEIAKHKPTDFLLISGDDFMTIPMVALGAEGVISVMANALPKEFAFAIKSSLTGNFEQARKQIFELSVVNDLLYREGNPVGVKLALELMGVCRGDVRLPLVGYSEGLMQKMKIALQSLNKL